MKRFYRNVAVAADNERYSITLDGKAVRTPGRNALTVPSMPLSEAIAEEWAAQGDVILPATMPMMRLAATAIDQVALQADAVAAETAKYAMTDLLCYRATEPRELVERQRAAWQPLLDWAAFRFDAPLRVSSGVMPVSQNESSVRALALALPVLEPFALTAIADLTALCGSLILALAVWQHRISAHEASDAALLDEIFQMEKWGEDAEATVRRGQLRDDIDAAARFLRILA